jgi:hypothetical protein
MRATYRENRLDALRKSEMIDTRERTRFFVFTCLTRNAALNTAVSLAYPLGMQIDRPGMVWEERVGEARS